MRSKHLKTLISTCILAAGLAVPVHDAAAGAWSQPEGGMYLRLASKYYSANKIFNASGNRVTGDWWDDSGRFNEISFNLIAEYGVLPWLTLTLENTYKAMHSSYDMWQDVRVSGPSDLLLGARWGFYQRDLVAAVEAKAEIPTGYERFDDKVSLGAAQFNGQFKLLFGGGLPLGFGNYFDTYFGYRVRGGGFDDDLMVGASIGVEAVEGLWFRAGTSGLFYLGKAAQESTSGNVADSSYLGVGAAATYLFDFGLGIELAGSADVWGKNSFAGWGMELVFQYKTDFYD